MAEAPVTTELTKLLGVKYPVMLAGMSGVSDADLAAAVTNAGGIGSVGGLIMSPKLLKQTLDDLKSQLVDRSLPFGVDLAVPQIGGSARKTNKDYTRGHMPELVDIIVQEGAKLFISAVGVPPRWMVDRLHAGGVVVANMVGSVRNAQKALESGADILIAQGSEGGGHTGEIGTMPLIPQVVDVCRGRRTHFGGPVVVVAAGGIYDGRGLAAALSLGASGVWVGTRFVAAEESAATKAHKANIVRAGSGDTIRTLVMSGRPMRLIPNDYIKEWEKEPARIQELIEQGIIPAKMDSQDKTKEPGKMRMKVYDALNGLGGQAVGGITAVYPAKKIVEDMVAEASVMLRASAAHFSKL